MDDRRRRFEAQVMPHLDAAYRYARWLTGGAQDAPDLVQEAVLLAFRGFDALRGANTKAWLLTIVRNCHFSAQRRAHARPLPLPQEDDGDDNLSLIADEPGPEELTMRADERRSLVQALQQLPPEYREILVLREVEDMDYRAIAQLVGLPIGTVMSRLARARAALRKQWFMHPERRAHVAP